MSIALLFSFHFVYILMAFYFALEISEVLLIYSVAQIKVWIGDGLLVFRRLQNTALMTMNVQFFGPKKNRLLQFQCNGHVLYIKKKLSSRGFD